MSHVSEIDLAIRSLDALKAACERMGIPLVEGKRTFRSYYGVKPCSHEIQVPGASYSVGITEKPDGSFSLSWDSYYSGGLENRLGPGAGLLKQAYGIEAAKIAARRRGFSCYEQVQEDGKTIQLVMRKGE